MKRVHSAISWALVLPGVAALLAGCGNKVLDFRNAEISNGKVYADGASTPFSGRVTNVPGGTVFGSQPGYAKLISTLTKISPDLSISDVGLTALCDAESSDGVLDGKVLCKEPHSDTDTIESKFSSGRLDGSFTAHDETGTKTLAQLSFSNGQPDGKMQIYSAKSGKLIHVATWAAGTLNGEEEGYNADTGNLILHGTLLNGAYDGELVRYAADGKTVLYKGSYVHGQLNGELERYDPAAGVREVMHYVDGKLDGLDQAWDASGKLIGQKTFANGVDVAEQQKADEKAELAHEIDLAVNDPDPKVAACVRAIVDHSGIAMNESQQNEYDAKLIARHAQCKTNPDSPAAPAPSQTATPAQSGGNDSTPPVTSTSSALHAQAVADGPATHRCGWIENDMPSSLALRDRDGTWQIAGGSASGTPAGFDQMPPTNKGDSCGCLTVETNRQAMQVVKILGGSLKPLSACQSDKSLRKS